MNEKEEGGGGGGRHDNIKSSPSRLAQEGKLRVH